MPPAPIKKQSQIEPNEKEKETPSLEILRPEVNFLVFPFFSLWDKDVHRRAKTEYKATIKRGGQKLEIFWRVSSNSDYGYPGPFDREVHKAIEYLISRLPLPIKNPIRLGSLYNLAKLIGITPSGRTWKQIKLALERITFTGIVSKGAFYNKRGNQWIEDAFHLYDRVVFKGNKMPNGEIADTNYLFLNSWYLDNINARYVKPVDWDYYRLLQTPIASRLYELLSVKFYGLSKKEKYIRYKYSTLCNLLPVSQQKHLSNARKVLDPAHQKLKETEFLADYSWEDISSTQSHPKAKDWYILYYPGKRAKNEIKKFRTYQIKPEPLASPEAKPQEQLKAEPESELSQDDVELVNELEKFGVSKVVAEDLVQHSDPKTIQRWMEAIKYKNDVEDKAAYLVKAVREDWQLPETFLREEGKREEEGRKQRILEEMESGQAKEVEIPASPECEETWAKVLSKLAQEVSTANFKTWLQNTSLIGIKDGIAFVGVPNEFTRDWLERMFKGIIAKALSEVLGEEVDLEFVVQKEEG